MKIALILISSCLAGFEVRYDGSAATNKLAVWLVTHGQAITTCPEIMAGFDIPRSPAEIVNGTASDVLDNKAIVQEINGKNVTDKYRLGADLVLKIAKENRVTAAFLKDGSPSCGNCSVYDGTFTGQKISGRGITAEVLKKNGIKTFSDNELSVENVLPFVDDVVKESLLNITIFN
ncbi:DUF523 domain-containing protein [Liquorilactobacillus mali]|uniref:DUF523 domain-containing protein n=1 Tax=Liquorilactobacillus mali TaxID=1618 RepID=UPI0023504803|nr:DUF523 domain-containing protein [Liquorilactobacillus mali]MDC7952633.1 DUF523 domain-containing protein [Liquorilactobacillus mali]